MSAAHLFIVVCSSDKSGAGVTLLSQDASRAWLEPYRALFFDLHILRIEMCILLGRHDEAHKYATNLFELAVGADEQSRVLLQILTSYSIEVSFIVVEHCLSALMIVLALPKNSLFFLHLCFESK